QRRHVNDLISLLDRKLSKTTSDGEDSFLNELPPADLMAFRQSLRGKLVILNRSDSRMNEIRENITKLTGKDGNIRKAIAQLTGEDGGIREEIGKLTGKLDEYFAQLMEERDRRKRYEIASQAYD